MSAWSHSASWKSYGHDSYVSVPMQMPYPQMSALIGVTGVHLWNISDSITKFTLWELMNLSKGGDGCDDSGVK